MKTVARIMLGLVALLMLGNGLAYMFVPDVQIGRTLITPDNIVGLANVRANIGAPAAAFGVFLIIAAIKAQKEAVLPFAVFAILAIIARVVGLVVDGFDPLSVRLLAGVGALLVVSAASYVMMQKNENASHQ